MKMKKFFYLMAMVCSIGLLASCGGDDDDEGGGSGPSGKRLPAIEGTWNVWSQGDDINGYKGSAQITWEVVDDAKINIDLGTGTAMPIPIKTTLVPLANSLANKFLPSLLKSVTFTADGQINAMVAGDIDDGQTTLWRSINGYSSYTVINDQLIMLHINADKATEGMDDPELKAQVRAILVKYSAIPINIRWNGPDNPYFYVDKAFIEPLIATMEGVVNKIPITDLDDDDIKTFKMIKGVLNQLPAIMDQTTKFEAGIELTR